MTLGSVSTILPSESPGWTVLNARKLGFCWVPCRASILGSDINRFFSLWHLPPLVLTAKRVGKQMFHAYQVHLLLRQGHLNSLLSPSNA
jgi:hypothetical protein